MNNKSFDNKSSAENVEQHLQELEKADYELLYYSQEQTFNSKELASLINEKRLHELLAQSDAFLNSLNSEMEDFEGSPDFEQKK
ncbi:hypothetical protein [Psychrobacter ciconiae]|uniref:hypothetical protein n=1 Tax=Psychrobacter ciconiae TaxID=1553449 RepID=UPI00191AD031|nr:hypothetical protein [Psychrobacter ciconiae]